MAVITIGEGIKKLNWLVHQDLITNVFKPDLQRLVHYYSEAGIVCNQGLFTLGIGMQ